MNNWTDYVASFDVVARREGIPLPQALRLVETVVYRGVADNQLPFCDAFSFSVEKAWHEMGRPSYRVALPLAEALADTDLDVDGAFLRFPHAAFALELPKSFCLRNKAGHRLSGLLVGAVRDVVLPGGSNNTSQYGVKVEAPDGEGTWRLTVMQAWEGEDTVVCLLTLSPGITVEAVLRDAVASLGHDASITDAATTRKFIALALGAALFAVGSNRFVHPVGSGLPKRRGRKAANRAPEPRRWSLGADIQLPRGRSVATTSHDAGGASEDGRELRFSHIRQGHLRLTPTGPREDRSFVLRYIAPTLVRPDLPLAQRATRHAMAEPEVTDSSLDKRTSPR